MSERKHAQPIEIAGHEVAPGARKRIEIHVASDVTGSDVVLPVEVVHGREAGPCLFVCAAIHGDEINGVEIIRRILRQSSLRRIRGSLIAVPIVNVFGFIGHSRYLPDRRDLNRSFPGSASGSLASRVAYTFLKEVVEKSTHGIDLHTGAVHRTNLPQVRACLNSEETSRLAHAFGAPLILNAELRDGSLREAVTDLDVPFIVYEAGEALRFDETAIRAGVRGVTAVMAALGMVPPRTAPAPARRPFVAQSTTWVRAPTSGIVRPKIRLGASVEVGDRMAVIADPLGTREVVVEATKTGVIIGKTELPLVNEGDALFHIASLERPKSAASSIERFQAEFGEAEPGSVLADGAPNRSS
jgi:predicted deacylase